MMKTIKYILTALFLSAGLWSCSDQWDSHYSQEKQEVNNPNIVVSELSASNYLKSESSLSSMYQLFDETGVVKEMEKRTQLFTLLVVGNEGTGSPDMIDDKEYLAKNHITDIALSPANIFDGQRVLMWSGKYLNITKVKNGANDDYTIYFNGTKVTKVIKVDDGYIYMLESYVNSPKSMYEIIEDLDENYSEFKKMILSRNQKKFDKEASRPIGVDNTGSTVYDSVFVITNPYFLNQKFDLMSESLTATMFIPSNEVINEALTTAGAKLDKWQMIRVDTIIENWIFQTAFFNEQYTKENLSEDRDLTSVFGKQWRTSKQELDLDKPVPMSNGTAYYMKSLKIPTNVLIYRLKDHMRWYENLTNEDKDKYFASENLTFDIMETKVTAWSGWPAGGFPTIENRVVKFNLTDATSLQYTMNFTPFRYKDNGNGSYTATPYLVPPGEYTLHLGFEQKLGHDVEISVNGKVLRTVTTSELTSSTFHYDRGGSGYPEGYDVSKATNSKKGNYDRDGGLIGTVTITGTEPVQLLITFKGVNVTGKKTCFHHWCLRPTLNCY